MNTGTKGLIVFLLLIAVGVAVFVLFSNPADRPEDAGPINMPEIVVEEPDQPVETVVVERQEPREPTLSRTAIDSAESGASFEQGVYGRLTGATGLPVEGARCYLFEGAGGNLFQMMMKMQKGAANPPLAACETDVDGVFRLGIKSAPPGKVYDLRILSDHHPEKTQTNLTIFAGRWLDRGIISLDQGSIVEGSVRAKDNGSPIAGATVTIQTTGQPFSFGNLPGRENGIETVTDINGRFLIANAGTGAASVSVAAPGYARVSVQNANLTPQVPAVLDFALPPGKQISGVVVNSDGMPIPGATIQSYAISAKTPINVSSRSDPSGRFEIIGLVDGPYQLDVTAHGFIAAQVKPVMAGASDEQIVLEDQGKAKVKVMSAEGRLQKSYQLDVRRYFPGQDTHGFVPNRKTERVKSSDLEDGWFEVSGLDPAQYIFEVSADKSAKGFSEPFEITAGGEIPEVEMSLPRGGAITGMITDVDGQPLGGAVISTLPNYYEDSALTEMFGGMAPSAITDAKILSRPDGTFKLDRLTPGAYQIKVAHPEAYSVYRRDIEVAEGKTTEIEPQVLASGTRVYGTAYVDGRPTGQIKVLISTIRGTVLPDSKNNSTFRETVVTDSEGHFELRKRLPPGSYEATAHRQGGNPLIMVLDHKNSKQSFEAGPQVKEHQIIFQIQSL